MLRTPARPIATGLDAHQSLAKSWISSRYFTLVALTLALPFICLAGRPLFGDVWWVLASGRSLVEQGQILQADPFTFAPHNAIYFDVQWLAQLLYYSAYEVGGLEAVAVFNAAVASLTFGLLLRVAWQRSQNMAAATISVLAAELTALWFLLPRAQTLAFAAFAATMCLLICARPRARVIVALGVVEAVWTNLHGSFFIGPLLTGLLLGGELIELVMASRWRSALRYPRVRFLLAAIGAQLIGTLLNPYGPGIYTYLLKFPVDPIIRDHILEWLPTTAGDAAGAEFFGSVALTLIVLGITRMRVKASDVLILGVFGILGVQAFRNIPWWALTSSAILAAALARISVPPRLAQIGRSLVTSKRQVRGNIMRGALLSIVLVAALPGAKAANPWLPAGQRSMIPTEYPEAATNFLATHQIGSRIFGEHPWGAYIDWWLFPRYEAMIDPAIEVHPAQVWLDALTIDAGHVSWEELLNKYSVDVLMLRRETEQPLIEAADRSPNWQPVYQDDQTIIYTRTTTVEVAS
jgi:hypothetical protein